MVRLLLVFVSLSCALVLGDPRYAYSVKHHPRAYSHVAFNNKPFRATSHIRKSFLHSSPRVKQFLYTSSRTKPILRTYAKTKPFPGSYTRTKPFVATSANTKSSFGSSASASLDKLVDVDINSPTAKAALAYVNEAFSEDACGGLAKLYIETVLTGGSVSDANAKATEAYMRQYREGNRPVQGTPCAASEAAFRQAFQNGENPVFAAALAYMRAYESESPCFAAAKDYVEAVVEGSTPIEARIIAAKSFIGQIKVLAAEGKETIDPVCTEAAQAYTSTSDLPSSTIAAAMQAFISKSTETGTGFDPVCNSAAEKFFESYEAGKSELESTLDAAKAYLGGYKNNPIPASQSPCAAAAKAFATSGAPGAPTDKALLAFIDAAVSSNDAGLDPVCSASAEAYINAFTSGSTEEESTEAAAVAYLDAIEANSDFDPNSPCGLAGKAYIESF